MGGWTIISKHGLVLVYIYERSQSTAREIASAVGVTEWTVHKIVAELEAAGYIERQRVGRSNVYSINSHLGLRHDTVQHVSVGDLLELLSRRERRVSSARKAAKSK